MGYFTIGDGELPCQIRHMFLPPVLPQVPEPWRLEKSLVETAYNALTRFRALRDAAEAAETRRIDRCIRMLRRMASAGKEDAPYADVLWRQIADLGDNGRCYEYYYLYYHRGTAVAARYPGRMRRYLERMPKS